MIIKQKVDPKGQVIIPKDFRDLLNIHPGSEILIEIKGDEIFIRAALDAEAFLEIFFKTTKKLNEKIDLKKLLNDQYEKDYNYDNIKNIERKEP